jgi:hypothetical protein
MKTAATCCNTSDHRREVVQREREISEKEREREKNNYAGFPSSSVV